LFFIPRILDWENIFFKNIEISAIILGLMPTLNITEIFLSIQGECQYTGLPTVFLRLSGCHIRCSWCDTSYSFKRGDSFTLNALEDKILSYKTKHVCITGGEPLLQKNVYPLMTRLCDAGLSLSLETSGTLDTSQVDTRVACILDVKCPGSGQVKHNYWSNLDHLHPNDEVKFVISDREDYEFAKSICEKYKLYDHFSPPLFSPVFEKINPQDLVDWFLEERLPVRLNLQTHKYIWNPDTQGV